MKIEDAIRNLLSSANKAFTPAAIQKMEIERKKINQAVDVLSTHFAMGFTDELQQTKDTIAEIQQWLAIVSKDGRVNRTGRPKTNVFALVAVRLCRDWYAQTNNVQVPPTGHFKKGRELTNFEKWISKLPWLEFSDVLKIDKNSLTGWLTQQLRVSTDRDIKAHEIWWMWTPESNSDIRHVYEQLGLSQ